MPRVYTHELAYHFQTILRRALRGRKNVDELIRTISEDLMDKVPSEAFEAKCAADAGILFWTGETDDESALEIQAELISAHLSLKPTVPINLLMSNCGGWISSGTAVISTIYRMRREKRVVNITVSGDACSMGSVILQAADHRAAEEGTLLMIHNPSSAFDGRIDSMEDHLHGLRMDRDFIYQIYAHRSGKPVSYWKQRMDRKDLYLTPKQALSEGLVDEVLKRP